MVKKICMVMCIVMVIGLLGACGNSAADNTAATKTSVAASESSQPTSSEPVNIKIFQAAPEFTDGMNELSKLYNSKFPNVKVDVEILQADYPTVLRARISSGDLPDVFWSTTGAELKLFSEYSADMTNEPYFKDMIPSVVDAMTYQGKIIGLPLSQLSMGVIYNKDIFASCGITELPQTWSQLEDACKKIQAKGIVPFGNGFKEWWVYKHIFNNFIGAEKNNVKMVQDFIAGNAKFADYPTAAKILDFVDFANTYGLPKPLEVDFNTEVSAFATGKVAMITGQGEWAEDSITKITPNIKMGYMPMPVDENPDNTRIVSSIAYCWMANKDSKNIDEVKKMFNWLYTSEEGKKLFPEKFKVIGPFKEQQAPNTQLGKEATELIKNGKSFPSLMELSTNSFHQKFGEIIQSYIGKVKTKEQTYEEIQKAWQKLGEPQ